MNDTRQRIFADLGSAGCYIFSMIRHAEDFTQEYIDAYQVFREAVALGHVREDCYVLDPAAFMSKLTGRKWTASKEDADYQCKPGELEILRFERQAIGITISHFVAGDGLGHVYYDPEGSSITVAHGALQSKRIFRLEA